MQLSDPVLIAIIGFGSGFLAFIGSLLASRRSQEKTLNETVDNRVKLLLAERDQRVAELTTEIHALKEVISEFRTVLSKMLVAGAQCDRHVNGNCPIGAADIAAALNQAAGH